MFFTSFLTTYICTTKKKSCKKYKNDINRTPSVFNIPAKKGVKKPNFEISSFKEEKDDANKTEESKKISKENEKVGNILDNHCSMEQSNFKGKLIKNNNLNILQKDNTLQLPFGNSYRNLTDKNALQTTQQGILTSNKDLQIKMLPKKSVATSQNIIDPVKTVRDCDVTNFDSKMKQIEDPVKTILCAPDILLPNDTNNVTSPNNQNNATSPLQSPKDKLSQEKPDNEGIKKQPLISKNEEKSENKSLMNDSKAMNDQYETLTNIVEAIPPPPPPLTGMKSASEKKVDGVKNDLKNDLKNTSDSRNKKGSENSKREKKEIKDEVKKGPSVKSGKKKKS